MQTRRNFLGQAAAAVGTTGVLAVNGGIVVPERTIAAPKPPPDSAKKPRIKNLRHVEMYREPTNYCAEVQVEKLGGGEMVAVFGRDPGLQHIDAGSIPMIRSRDHGRTWDQKNAVTVFPIGDDYGWSTPSISKLSDGRLVAVAYGYELLTESGAPDFGKGYAGVLNPTGGSDFVNPHVAWSDDRGRTWTPPQKVRIAPMRLAAVRDAIVEMPDGALLLAISGLRSRHPMPEVGGGETWTAFVVRSTDGGRQWHYWGTMANDPLNIRNYWEPALLWLRDGRLLGMMRAPQFAGQYRSGGYFFMTVSDDGGASWSEPKRTNIFAFGNPADLIQLNDGRVVCTYGRRRPPYGVFLAVSDDGLSWDGTEATLREYKIPQSPRLRGAGFPFHIGYASSVQLDSGEIFTAYHLFDEEGLQIVEGAIFELE